MSSNRFEVLKDRVMQRGEGSGRKIGKDRREILREEKEKKERKIKIKVQKKDLEKKKEKKVDNEKEKKIEKMIEKEEKTEIEEREVEMRGFSGGEILKGRYPLAWWKMWCYECGGLGHRKRDHREIGKDKEGDKGRER